MQAYLCLNNQKKILLQKKQYLEFSYEMFTNKNFKK